MSYPLPIVEEIEFTVVWPEGRVTGGSPVVVVATAPAWPVPVYVPIVPVALLPMGTSRPVGALSWAAFGDLPRWTGVSTYPLEVHGRTVEAVAAQVRRWVRTAVAVAADGFVCDGVVVDG